MGDPPQVDIEQAGSTRRIRVSGDWRLQALLAKENDVLHKLRSVRGQPSDQWDLTRMSHLDSLGALALWHCWGEHMPEHLAGGDAHAPMFERLGEHPLVRPPVPGRFARLRRFLPALGEAIHSFSRQAGGSSLVGGQFFVDLWHCVENPRLFPLRELSATIYRAGAQSLILLAFLGLLVGMMLTYEISGQLVQFGLNQQIIGAVGLAFTREIGPFIAGLVLVGRMGSATTASIGGMRLTEEIDALRALGVSPTLRIVMPRVLAMTVVMPLLVVWIDFWGVLGGVYLSNNQLGVTWQMWLAWFPNSVPIDNYFIGIGKGALFGFIIGVTSAYYGLTAPRDTQSISSHTTRAVVVGFALVLIIEVAFGFMFSGVGL
ncbi:MAG TPA: ABC transporter permease [Gammaproteobacteria bacterium]|nr:ABC transporter permease [Gammaproteobacteria bacterium]